MNIKYATAVAFAVAFSGLSATASQAATVTGNLTADNQFSVYISTSDSTLGTLLASGNNWPTTYSFSTPSRPAPTIFMSSVTISAVQPTWLAAIRMRSLVSSR